MIAMREPSKFLFMSGGFFEELQRRKVYRVAAAYVIAAGFILLIGFPIALILAWAFDVTSEGIQATEKTAAETHLRRNMIILAATGVIVSVSAGFFLLPRASGHKIDKSIAVLPFENLSGDPDNAYFADGIQDDILTNLSKIGDLQVINASTDEHIWAEDYDRDLTDVFAIQTDLAQKIVYTLQAKLSPNEKARLDRRPTQDPNAYLLFVQAHDYANRTDMFRDTSVKAEPLF